MLWRRVDYLRLPLHYAASRDAGEPEMLRFHQEEMIQGQQTSLEKRIHVASDSGKCSSGGRICRSLESPSRSLWARVSASVGATGQVRLSERTLSVGLVCCFNQLLSLLILSCFTFCKNSATLGSCPSPRRLLDSLGTEVSCHQIKLCVKRLPPSAFFLSEF